MYFQHISLRLLKRMMVLVWLGVLCLVCAPFCGFGLYWDEKQMKCSRYRDAKKTWDVIYAYLFLSYGKYLEGSPTNYIHLLTGRYLPKTYQIVDFT